MATGDLIVRKAEELHKSDSQGWALHFLNPDHPRMSISLQDLSAVIGHLQSEGLIMCDRPTLVSPGVLQVKFGRGGGNLQVYPGATGRSAAAAQPALKVAFEWAKGIRMVFNVGVDKSACLVSYDGSAPTADMKFPDGQSR